jgi:hypothetical protein
LVNVADHDIGPRPRQGKHRGATDAGRTARDNCNRAGKLHRPRTPSRPLVG